MNIAIIEDEVPALSRIKKLIAEVAPYSHILFTADSIESAVSQFKKYPSVDLALFDIELADGQSFEIFKQTEIRCPIIFTTAYDEFALKAFKLNSIDYLLKPIDKEELQQAIAKFNSLQNHQTDYANNLQSLIESFVPQQTTYKARFLIKNGNRLISLSVDDIAYFHAFEKVVYVYTHTQQKYIIDYSLDELNKLLHPQFFFQLNRQIIANVKAIKNIHSYFNGKLKVELLPPMQEETIVSREKASDFKQWLDQ
jgi:two-component system LytT family response regulator